MVTGFMYKMWDFIQTKGKVLDAWRQSSCKGILFNK